jgi:hypothetical protein
VGRQADRVVTLSFIGVRNDEVDGITDRRSLRGTTALDVLVLLETVTAAFIEEPDFGHKR